MTTNNKKKPNQATSIETTHDYNTPRDNEWKEGQNKLYKKLSNNKINNTINRDINNKYYRNNIMI
jgi:hypothetical protein